jgi:hypothetical protein
MCAFIGNALVGFVVGVLSSTTVAIVFYRLSSRDSQTLHRCVQLDSVLLRLKQLDPMRWQSMRGPDGVDDTSHWMICMSEIMRETGFDQGAQALTTIFEEMRQVCSGPNEVPTLPREESERRKKMWEAWIYALRDIQPRSLLNRSKRK